MFGEISLWMWRYINNPHDLHRRSSIFAHILSLKDVALFAIAFPGFEHRLDSQRNRYERVPEAPNPWLHMTCNSISRFHVIKLNKFSQTSQRKRIEKERKIQTLKSFISFLWEWILFLLTLSTKKGEQKEENFYFVFRKLFQSTRALSV